MPNVRLVGVSKHFGPVQAVDHVHLDVPDGALMTLLGPSGCGKTTLLRLVAGLERTSSGDIFIGKDCVSGEGVFVPPEKRQIGMVFQSYAIWPHMRVFDNVAYPLKVRRLGRREIQERTMKALRTVQLEALAERYATQLSGGQQQRVAVARAIVFEPRILLLDEPLSNLDANLRDQMRVEIRELQQRLGITTIYVTHDQSEALAVSDRIAVMEHGKLVQIGTPRQIFENPRTRFVADFVGWANFLAGEVVDRSTVQALGTGLRCPVPLGLPAGAAVYLGVRPENVELVADVEAIEPNTVYGQVKAAMYLGTHVACQLLVNGHVVHARAPTTSDLPQGRPVGVRLAPEHILVLPT